MWDSMVHPVYLTEHLLGYADSVYGVARKVKEDTFDSLSLLLQNDQVGLVEFVYAANWPSLELRLLGEDGECLQADLVNDVFTRRSLTPMGNRAMYAMHLATEDARNYLAKCMRHLRNYSEIRSYPGAFPYQKTFFTIIGRYLSFLRGEAPNPPVSGEDGLRTVKVLEAARKSIDTGRVQRVKTV